MDGRADAEEFDRLLSTVLPIVVRDSAAAESGRLYRSVMARVETPLLRHALELSAGNQLKAARLLGISLASFYRKLRGETVDTPERTN